MSDIHIPTDSDDPDSFFPGKDDSKPYNILHKGWKFLIRAKNGVGGIVSGFPIPESEEFDIHVDLSLTRKRTNQAKALALTSPFFKILLPNRKVGNNTFI